MNDLFKKKKKKNPPSPNPRAFFGRELKKTVCTESLVSYVTSGTIWFCVCVCVFYYCTRDLGRVTVNTRLVNSHQQEQTGWCLFAFLPRLFLSVLQCVISCMCLRNIYYLTLQVFTIPQAAKTGFKALFVLRLHRKAAFLNSLQANGSLSSLSASC